MKHVDLSLILACYNEEGLFVQSVKRIVSTLQNSNLSYEIIFVDDKSTDNTVSLIKKTSYRAIFHDTNMGRGRSVADGMLQAKGKVVGYIDIDCEVGPEYIPHMVSYILQKKADVVIGRRMYRSSLGSLVREVLSRGYQWLSDMMVGTNRLDTETGYKFFRRSKIVPILAQTEACGWFWDTEIMVRCIRAGLVVEEVPVLFLRRFDKESSVRIVRDTMDYVVQLWKFRKRFI